MHFHEEFRRFILPRGLRKAQLKNKPENRSTLYVVRPSQVFAQGCSCWRSVLTWSGVHHETGHVQPRLPLQWTHDDSQVDSSNLI